MLCALPAVPRAGSREAHPAPNHHLSKVWQLLLLVHKGWAALRWQNADRAPRFAPDNEFPWQLNIQYGHREIQARHQGAEVLAEVHSVGSYYYFADVERLLDWFQLFLPFTFKASLPKVKQTNKQNADNAGFGFPLSKQSMVQQVQEDRFNSFYKPEKSGNQNGPLTTHSSFCRILGM